MEQMELRTANLYDLTHTAARPLLEKTEYPWEALPKIGGLSGNWAKPCRRRNMNSGETRYGLQNPPKFTLTTILQVLLLSGLKPRCVRVRLSEAMPWWELTVWWEIPQS